MENPHPAEVREIIAVAITHHPAVSRNAIGGKKKTKQDDQKCRFFHNKGVKKNKLISHDEAAIQHPHPTRKRQNTRLSRSELHDIQTFLYFFIDAEFGNHHLV